MADVSISQTDFAVTSFYLVFWFYFTYLWNLFDCYYHSVKQAEEFVKERRAREEGRRRCCSEAAILQRSLIISKAKMCKSHNKDKMQPFSSSSPVACLLFTFSAGTYGVIQYASCRFLCRFLSPSLRLQYLSLSLPGTIRRLIRLSFLLIDTLCWWCSSTGEAGGWVAAIRTW